MKGLESRGRQIVRFASYFFVLGSANAVLESSVSGWRRIELMGKGRFSKK